VHVASEDFYAAALDELERAPQVELRLGERVLELGDGWARTDRERLEGTVHDGLALASPALRGRPPMALWQGFLGWEVRLDRPLLEPGVATLMDFRDSARDHVEFIYVLPFASDAGLVEHTTFAAPGPPPAHRREALRAFLSERLGAREWDVEHEERGRIPMTAAPWPASHGSRTSAIGTAGGAVRPSSGYAFSRTQAHVLAVAEAVKHGRALPERAGSRRGAWLDRVFLGAMDDDPGAFGGWIQRLVERVPPDVFARFMNDHASPADELRVMAALPPAPFVRAALIGARPGSVPRV
jgi:lycopene beta-cyclase